MTDGTADDFRLTTPDFSGPMDLLLYLVRKHEVPILELSVSSIIDQYLAAMDVLREIDINGVGDFLSMATLLMEIKSQEMLPGEVAIEEEIEDPRQELVQHLLAYKEYYDTATELERRSRQWQQYYPRVANDLPRRATSAADAPIAEVELWDLVSAFGRLIREASPSRAHQVVYDDTPISTHMTNIYTRLRDAGRLGFRDLFEPGQHKTTMIGIFLALLELVRHEYAVVEQQQLFGEIELTLRNATRPLEFAGLAVD